MILQKQIDKKTKLKILIMSAALLLLVSSTNATILTKTNLFSCGQKESPLSTEHSFKISENCGTLKIIVPAEAGVNFFRVKRVDTAFATLVQTIKSTHGEIGINLNCQIYSDGTTVILKKIHLNTLSHESNKI